MKKLYFIFGVLALLCTGVLLVENRKIDNPKTIHEDIRNDKLGQDEEKYSNQDAEEDNEEIPTHKLVEDIEAGKIEYDKQEEETSLDIAYINKGLLYADIDQESELSMKEIATTETVKVQEAAYAALNIINPSIQIDAVSGVLMDCDTGRILYHKNALNPVYPASTTKIMTALIALEVCKPEDEITVGDEVTLMASDSTRAYLSKGQRLTLNMLLEGLLLPSGNDAAYVVAAHVGRVISGNNNLDYKKAVEVFVTKMNDKGKELGLVHTQFRNPDGYDHEEQYSTAYDMAIIAREALKNERIIQITKKTKTRNVFLSGEDVTWKTTNRLISVGSGFYNRYAIGLKTGTSSLAGRCLVSAAQKDGKTYVSVIMNSTATGRWEDSLELLKYAMDK